MIDTVKLSFNHEMSPQELKGWKSKHGEHKNGYFSHSYTYSIKTQNNSKITCFYLFPSYLGEPLLTLEFSLPKLLFGNNIQVVCDLDDAIFQANRKLENLPRIPEIDISKGEILRLDIAYNHNIGLHVKDYIDYLSKQSFSRRTTHSYLHSTAYFSNKTISSKFYDKFLESQLSEAQGLLRQEISYRNKGRIQVGTDADITIFDYETITENATYQHPYQYSSGVKYVLVNGVLFIDVGQGSSK